jgi:alpha-amylase/alpha-mannosidase (GH57 family)
MPGHIYLCFVWHMHQPYYKDLVTGEYKLPWTRLHALKDYYGMVKILEGFPKIRQTFNLVPSLLAQVEEYASGKAADPFFRVATRPAADLSLDERVFLLKYSYYANEQRLIGRYPRYAQLFDRWRRLEHAPQRAAQEFTEEMIRDLQVLSQLAWFDEEYLARDPVVARLAQKGKNFSGKDQAALAEKQIKAIGNVIPAYQEFAAKGQIEVSTTPYYHPILPLICDSNIAADAHPNVPLPSRFRYPADAEEQIRRAQQYVEAKFGARPNGLWPSEGSVSDEALGIAARLGFKWAASDDGVLGRTLGQFPSPAVFYQPFLWRQADQHIGLLFRDHHLSDLIGFVYSRMEAHHAASHFVAEIRARCQPLISAGRDAVVPIILDGENAWESYDRNGRPFLAELYRMISADSQMSAITASEAFDRVPPKELNHIAPGSWIGANFDVWIGSEEDNRAWELLLSARQTYQRVVDSGKARLLRNPEAAKTAWEELQIAEGSDWCWWYSPEHESANKPEFDQLYRDHLANVYRLLEEPVPTDISRPILKSVAAGEAHPPSGLIKPAIDGAVTSHLEWLGAGFYRSGQHNRAMHGEPPVIQDMYYGTDGEKLFLRLDFSQPLQLSDDIEFRLEIRTASGSQFCVTEHWQNSALVVEHSELDQAVSASLDKILETSVAFSALHVRRGEPIYIRLAVFRDGLPVGAIPTLGELEMQTSEPIPWGY